MGVDVYGGGIVEMDQEFAPLFYILLYCLNPLQQDEFCN